MADAPRSLRQPPTLKETIGRWLKEIESPEQLLAELNVQLEESAPEIAIIQQMLIGRLNASEGDVLADQLSRLDAYYWRLGSFLADAEALLDIAERIFLIPQGQMVQCLEPDGTPHRHQRGVTKAAREEVLLAKLTDKDREIDIKAKCVVFRRLRDEYRVMMKVMENRFYLGQRILDALGRRDQAAGYSAGKRG